ncbi:MAG: hypothetical protein OXJ52_02630 [Oligoflexia bacterium]|nr:hypothetical protein [Oligoflexia bacterium]
MQAIKFIEQNTISPYKEMLAYETLWALKNIKEKKLTEYFNSYTPSETLKEISSQSQSNLFLSNDFSVQITDKVNEFLDTLLKNNSK